jgi:sigma-B regulation protein RsbU (phosphoserine phosphatase)
MIRQRWLSGLLNGDLVGATSHWLQALGDEFDFAHDDLYRIQLCFEELVNNVVDYSAARYAGHAVELRALIDARRVTLTLIDPAAGFDPLGHAPPPLATRIEDMPIGGQGIHLAREFSDAQRYERRDDKNHMTLVFELAQPPRGAEPRAPELMSTVQIFCGVTDAAIVAHIEQLPIQEIVGERLMLRRGDINDAVRVVLQGRLRVHLDQPQGSDFMTVLPGDCVGEMSIIDDTPVSAFVVAESGTRLLLIDAATFLDQLLAIPKVSRNLVSSLNSRTRRNDQLAIDRMRKLLQLEQAQRELQYARSIQASLLPQEPLFPGDARLDCVGRMCPAREVGGDFYDIFQLDARHLFFVVADVCGKGLPAALYMVRAIAALRVQSLHEAHTADYAARLMARLNEQMVAHNDAMQFLTAFCGILELPGLRLRYVNAGHNPPLLAQGGAGFRYLDEPINPMVGMIDGLEYRCGELRLEPGSLLLLYTDGVTEAENMAQGMFGEERLLARVDAITPRTAANVVDAVFDAVGAFAGAAPQSDDITVLAIRCPA